MESPAPSLQPRKSGPRLRAIPRIWVYRAACLVLVPLAVLGALEAGLRIAGFGRPVGFLIPDSDPGYFRTNPQFVSWFLPDTFDLRPINFRVAASKPPNTVRIVLLGESAAQGVPEPHFGFAAQLRAQLRARYPGKQIEVINTGIVAINSHVVYQVARELAAFEPDLFVVYMGNNEVVGPYGPGCAYLSQAPPMWVIRLSVFVKATRTGQWLRSLAGKVAGASGRGPEWGGMSMFVDSGVRGDDPRLEATYRNFETNLRDIVRVARRSGSKALLCTVACNLKDCAPFLSLHRPQMSAVELESWGKAFAKARLEWMAGQSEAARADIEEALRIDPQYADASFILGRLDLDEGRLAQARAHFADAEHWDALRFRPDPRINEIVRNVARESDGVGFLDAAGLLGSDPASSAPIAGRELFLEHVHFDWAGNYRIARAMAERAEAILFGPATGGRPWFDSPHCAAAVGYTAHERFGVLQKMDAIVQNPPFTNQLTYIEDQATLSREMAVAQADCRDAAKLRHSKAVVDAAIAADPSNPDLARIEEDIDDDLGDVQGALDQARRFQELQPKNFAIATDEAIKLSRLGRYGDAERLLGETIVACSPRDRLTMIPAFADFFARTGRFKEGRHFLDLEVARNPGDLNVRLVRGRLDKFAGELAAAEREYRAVLAADPSDQNALEALVALLEGQGQSARAEEASLAVADHQPRNHTNNLRAAVICDRNGDLRKSTHFLLAAEKSGPISSAIELRIARTLLAEGLVGDARFHLAEARELALIEGDAGAAQSMEKAILQL